MGKRRNRIRKLKNSSPVFRQTSLEKKQNELRKIEERIKTGDLTDSEISKLKEKIVYLEYKLGIVY